MSDTKNAKGTKKKPAAKKQSNSNGTEAPQSAGLPMFYKSATLLNSDAYGDLHLKPLQDCAFAKQASSIVIAAGEFSQAAMNYPIVFSRAADGIIAHVVTGHTAGQNLFVDENNKWRQNVYIPAYIRRYPFLLLESEDKETLSLLIDLESGLFSKDEGEKLYEDGKATETAERALQFCATFHRELLKSAPLYKQIDDCGLFVERSADVTLPDSRQAKITGFSVVDEKILNELDDKKFLELRKSGALTLIYCHLWSMRAWNNLLA